MLLVPFSVYQKTMHPSYGALIRPRMVVGSQKLFERVHPTFESPRPLWGILDRSQSLFYFVPQKIPGVILTVKLARI